DRPPAVVVAVQLPDVSDGELASSIAELERLARTLGLALVGRVTQRRSKLAPGVVLGEGKLRELGAWTGGSGVIEAYQRPGRRKRDDDGDGGGGFDDGDADDVELDDAGDPGDPAAASDVAADVAAPAHRARVVLVDHDLTPTQQRNLEKA